MKITIVCAGKIKEKYLSAGIAEFLKRLKPYAQVEIREIHEEKMPEAPSPAEKEQTLAREGEKLLKLVPEGSYLYVLDVYGKLKSSEEVRARADERISFSPMTFTHQMVRLLLVEQIYRAFKINRGEKYHW